MVRTLTLSLVLLAGVSAQADRPSVAIRADAAGEAQSGSVDGERVAPTNKPWIGFWLRDLVDGGVMVVHVVPGGPADKAALRSGDVILLANDRQIAGEDVLEVVLDDLVPGDALDLRVVRDGETLQRQVRVGSRASRPASAITVPSPAAPPKPAPPSSPRLLFPTRVRSAGFEVAEITPGLRVHYGSPEDAGVLVIRSDPESVAGKVGVRVGDVIVRVNDVEITSRSQIERALSRWNPSVPLEARVIRNGEPELLRIDSALARDVQAEQDREAVLAREREARTRRIRLELQRLERRVEELRRALEELEDGD